MLRLMIKRHHLPLRNFQIGALHPLELNKAAWNGVCTNKNVYGLQIDEDLLQGLVAEVHLPSGHRVWQSRALSKCVSYVQGGRLLSLVQLSAEVLCGIGQPFDQGRQTALWSLCITIMIKFSKGLCWHVRINAKWPWSRVSVSKGSSFVHRQCLACKQLGPFQ